MREGDEIPIFYDALLAKLIVWGTDREDARRGLETALTATAIAGVAHNRDFLVRLVQHREFAAGGIDTGFIERHRAALTVPLSAAPLAAVAAASLAWLYPEPGADPAPAPGARDTGSPWRRHDGWRLAGTTTHALDWLDDGLERHLDIVFERAGLTLILDEVVARVKYIARHDSDLELELDSVPLKATVERQGDRFQVALKTRSWQLQYLDPLKRRAVAKAGPARLVAPVHGRVLDVLVAPGAAVKRGQALMLLECMKLEYRITAPADGTIDALHFAAGDVVEDGAQLIDFTPAAG